MNDIVFVSVSFIVILSAVSAYLYYCIYRVEKKREEEEYKDLLKLLRQLRISLSSKKSELKFVKKVMANKQINLKVADAPDGTSVN